MIPKGSDSRFIEHFPETLEGRKQAWRTASEYAAILRGHDLVPRLMIQVRHGKEGYDLYLAIGD